MKKITVSAPGKLMLLGEHAVVYNRPCIVTAVNQRMRVTVELLEKPEFYLKAPDVNIVNYKKSIKDLGEGDMPKSAKFVEIAVKNFLDFTKEEKILRFAQNDGFKIKNDNFGFKIVTKSEFSPEFGFGSSSAVTVCVIKALSELLGIKLSKKQLFDLAYRTVLDIQGKGSGFDVAAAIYGGTIYFKNGGKIIESLKVYSLPLIVGYSGMKADTVTLMNKVKEKFINKQEKLENIYDAIKILVQKAKEKFLVEDFKTLGELMYKNQTFLSQLGVSIPKLDTMINAAIAHGAYGAKLSGAGGGDCIIAVAPDEKINSVKKAIKNVGGQILEISANAGGVRVE